MASLNKVMIIGNLGKDPETRTLQSGMTVTSITVATNESYTDRNGNKVDQTEWHNVELWDNLSKIASQYLRKGSPVYIEGKIKTDSWEDNGVKKYITKIRALSLQLLGGRGEGGSTYVSESEAPKVASKGTADVSSSNSATDDLPF
jgi:single-strand DNA-binding protein